MPIEIHDFHFPGTKSTYPATIRRPLSIERTPA
jgi:hypothetical protein